MKYGVAYYPEQREPAQMDAEIALMKDAGINVVRMGEFAWCRFEPSEGVYDFGWLDTAVEKLAEAGIESVICTPTACPPAWLSEKHPEIRYVDNRGVVRPFGGRRNCCYSHPVYREYCRQIAEQIAVHYGRNPAVYAFQIDNELAQEGTGRCHCDNCRNGFRGWLRDKYGDIGSLNKRAGTIFWGQTYNRFDQIPMPVNTIEVGAEQSIAAYYENPTIRLEYERFSSDTMIAFQNIQLDAMRRYTDKIITTNGTGIAANSINYYEGFGRLDRYAFDFYPDLRADSLSSFDYAFGRGVKGQDFWVLEFVSGGGHKLGGEGRLQPYPGAMRQAVLHAFASGADLLAHFQFRTFLYGAEQLNYAILDADGVPRKRYYEMKDTAAELQRLRPFFEHSRFRSEAAVCFDYDTLWASRMKPVNRSFDYLAACKGVYDQLTASGIGADVIPFDGDFSKYRLVIAPAPFVLSEGVKGRLKEYVRGGGVLLATFLAGTKNSDNAGLAESLPCGMTDLFGITVEEAEPVFPSTVSKVSVQLGNQDIRGENRHWLEVLETHGAETCGILADTFRKGACVLSRNAYGRGAAYYLGTGVDDEAMRRIVCAIAEKAGVRPVPFAVEKGVEVVKRFVGEKEMYFLFNFRTQEVRVHLDRPYTGLSGEMIPEWLTLGPKGYALIG